MLSEQQTIKLTQPVTNARTLTTAEDVERKPNAATRTKMNTPIQTLTAFSTKNVGACSSRPGLPL